MQYNSEKELLKLSEYGRYVQEMAKHLFTIEDKEERNNYAKRIVEVMRRIQYYRSGENNERILWDHLAYITDYALDIDYPFEIVKREDEKPQSIPYPSHKIKSKHYGALLEKSIEAVEKLDDEAQKTFYESCLKSKMKDNLSMWTKRIITKEKLDSDYKEIQSSI